MSHQSGEIPRFNTNTGESVTPESNLINTRDIRIESNKINVNYQTLSRPVRDDQEQLFYDSETGEVIHPMRGKIVGENPNESSYVLQMIRFKSQRVCLFYDSGSNGSLISGPLAERLKLKVHDDRPVGIGTAGNGGCWSFYGSYEFGLGPDQEGFYYKIVARGMKTVTAKFKKYDLSPINDELRDRDPSGYGREILPASIGGVECGLLLGINCKLQPLLVFVLPSGLGVYRTQIKDESGSRLAYGGPHPVFSGVFDRTGGNANHTISIFRELVSQYLGSPYVQLTHIEL